MKLLIVGSQKTGNVWLERLLAKIYGLPIVDLSAVSQIPPPVDKPSFIAHQHYFPLAELLEWGERDGVRFLTMLRHPADIFVSLYYYVNTFATLWEKRGWIGTSPTHIMIGEAIDSPRVLEFMRTKFRNYVLKSLVWMRSGESLVVRYEDLSAKPVETLVELTNQIKPVDKLSIDNAIAACHIDNLRRESELLRLHCRRGKVGGWREELSDTHLVILRDCYAQELAELGYSLEEAAPAGGRGGGTHVETGLPRAEGTERGSSRPTDLERKIGELELEVASVETLLEIQSEDLGSKRVVIAAREEELASVKELLGAREEELASVKELLGAREEELANMKELLSAREAELANMKELLGAREEELANMKELLSAREEELASVKEVLAAREEELPSVKGVLGAREEELASLKPMLEDLGTEVDSLRTSVQNKEAENITLRDEMSELNTQLHELRSSVAFKVMNMFRRHERKA